MARQFGGPATVKSGAVRTHRGSHKRLRRIRLHGNWSTELLIAVFTIVLTLVLLLPLLLNSSTDVWH